MQEMLTVVVVLLPHDIVHQLVVARDAAALSSSLVCLVTQFISLLLLAMLLRFLLLLSVS